MSNLSEGQVIQAPYLGGPAEIKNIEERVSYYQLEIVLQDSEELNTSRSIFDKGAGSN